MYNINILYYEIISVKLHLYKLIYTQGRRTGVDNPPPQKKSIQCLEKIELKEIISVQNIINTTFLIYYRIKSRISKQ